MPEYVAFISSKSGVETSLDGKVMSVTKKVPTDRQTAFRPYIVDFQLLDVCGRIFLGFLQFSF